MTNSGGWVFPGWIGFSQWTKKEFGRFYKKEKGIYVPDDKLVHLALMSFEERRANNTWFDIFVDVRKYGWVGLFKKQADKWKGVYGGNRVDKREGRSRFSGEDRNEQQLELWN